MIPPGVWTSIGACAALALLLVGVSALLSAAETAIVVASRAKLHALEERGNRHARKAVLLIDDRDRFAGALLIGNTIVRVLAIVLAVAVFGLLYGVPGIFYAAGAMIVALVLFSEILPRSLAFSRPERLLLAVLPVLGIFGFLFGPFYSALHAVAVRVVGPGQPPEPPRPGRRELRVAPDNVPRATAKQDRDRLSALFDLHELEVSDVMVHRTNMRSVNADNPPEAVVREILQSPHTRMPLWRGSLDNIVGVLHAKDLLRALNEVGNDFSQIDVMKIATKPWFVPDTTTLQDQLNAFLRRKAHFAIVVDEYGEVEGLVTLEDIIEEIVGEIADEHDIDVQGVKQEADGSVVVDGSVPIRDLNRALDWQLPDDEATTIAGLVIHETQSIPEERQAFTFHGKRFVVMKREKNRITRIRIRPAEAAPSLRLRGEAG
jgi:Mg2+/Co2+ transporter CorB